MLASDSARQFASLIMRTGAPSFALTSSRNGLPLSQMLLALRITPVLGEIDPGVATPTEVEMAIEKGLRTLKFFPAEPMGGLNYLKAIAAPYVDVNFMPTGGINADNVATYLAFKRIVACGGSWMAMADWISGKQFDRIREESRRASEIAQGKAPAVLV